MSGFDSQFKTDQLMFPLRQRGAELQANAVAGLGQIPQQQIEWAQQKAESDAKIQAFAIERQLNVQKLKEMQMLDQAGMSRLAVEQLRVQNEQLGEQARAMRFQNDQAERDYKSGDRGVRDQAELQRIQRLAFGDTEGMFAAGYTPDPAAKGGIRKFKDEGEKTEVLGRYKEIQGYDRSREGPSRAIQIAMGGLEAELNDVADLIKILAARTKPTSEEVKALKDAYVRRETVLNKMRALGEQIMGTVQQYGGGPAATPTTTTSGDSDIDAMVDDFYNQIQQVAPTRKR